MKKIFGITIVIFVLLVSFLGITYSYEYNENESISFELIGPYRLYLNLGDEYKEYGIKVIRNGVDISSYVKIDNSSVDTSKVGEYKVKYELLVDGNVEYINRLVIVKENIKPEIKLIGDEVLYLNLNETYIEPGYEVSDNYDKDIEDKVIVIGNVDTSKSGVYTLEYKVIDSSGNESSSVRKVIVK